MNTEATVTPELLIEAGYKEYLSQGEEGIYCKVIKDDIGEKYQISFHPLTIPNRMRIWGVKIQLESQWGATQFELLQWFNDDGLYSNKTIADAEGYFEFIFAMHNNPYIKIY